MNTLNNEKNEIQLKCICENENTINLSSDIKCKKCNETLTGHIYKRFIFPTILTVGLSLTAGALLDDTLNLNRASVKTEYKMMKQCIDIYGNRDKCACAVESMSGFIDAQQARFYGPDGLRKILSERYKKCND
ncbi:hypothetical protein [Aliarcobacter cryaerophilus]|uniref:Uncharacterized protein n=1 Tax=Arcobacter sp. AZ-2023 TaxID=3074453 RepID=A0AA96DKA1_9BACT|nr:hypothetical protein RMQ68_09645 [Arcobacter sp. AZ-2023]